MVKITKENYNELVDNNSVVIIDFYADWCGPCRALGPIIERVSEEFPNVVFGKVNVDDEPELASLFNVQSIPFVAKIKDKKLASSFLGLQDQESIRRFFKD